MTYHNGAERRAVAAGLPLEVILLETDTPLPHASPDTWKRNEPAYIPLIAAEIAPVSAHPSWRNYNPKCLKLFDLNVDVIPSQAQPPLLSTIYCFILYIGTGLRFHRRADIQLSSRCLGGSSIISGSGLRRNHRKQVADAAQAGNLFIVGVDHIPR